MLLNPRIAKKSALILPSLACAALLGGCSLGSLSLSGPANTPLTVALNIKGTVHGGQAAISGSLLQLYAVGNTGYGSTATPLVPAGGVGSVSLTAGGSGYSSAPSVTFSGGSGTGAAATAVLSATVASLTLTGGGSGYLSAPTVIFMGGGGTGATATASLGTGAQSTQVVSLTLTNAGSGYTSAPTIVFSGTPVTPATATAGIVGPVTALQLTAAGTGYTSAPTIAFNGGGGSGAAATATAVPTAGVLTNSTGAFSITSDYTCPSANSLVYILATGGNSGAGTNTAIALASPLGRCGNLSNSTVVTVNELTTAAMAFAMSQYFTTTFGTNSTDSFGAPNTTQAQTGITNAMNTVGNLVNTGNGAVVSSNTYTTAGVGSITITPEYSKLITIGNTLGACVNSANGGTNGTSFSTACTTLFADVAPTGATSPTDVLQAAVYMNLNPTSANANGSSANLSALYNLPNGFYAFGGEGTLPTDWTLGITYGSNTTVAGSGTYLLYDPEHVAIDASGNVWLANFDTTSAGNSLTELDPTGHPLLQALTTIYGTNREIAIDQSGNVWVPDSYGLVSGTVTSAKGTTVYEFVPPVPPATTGTTNTFTTGNDPAAITFDGLGNAFVIEPSFANTTTASGAASTGTLEEIPAGSANNTVATTIATNLYTDFSSLVVDKNYTIWVTGGGTVNPGTAAGGVNGVYQFLKNTGVGTGYPAAPTATAVGVATTGDTTNSTLTSPEGSVAVDNAGDIIVDNYGNSSNSTVGGIAATSTTTLANAPNTFTTTGVTKQQFITLDGAGNIWTSQAASGGYVYAYTPGGIAISPSGGFVHTYKTPYQVAIDPSGNVWVGNSSASANATTQAFVTEIVGAAVPVVTPIAAGLPTTTGGTSTLASRP